jgi:hypothetical protein
MTSKGRYSGYKLFTYTLGEPFFDIEDDNLYTLCNARNGKFEHFAGPRQVSGNRLLRTFFRVLRFEDDFLLAGDHMIKVNNHEGWVFCGLGIHPGTRTEIIDNKGVVTGSINDNSFRKCWPSATNTA